MTGWELREGSALNIFIVVDEPCDWALEIRDVTVVAARSYLTDPAYAVSHSAKVFNLCKSYRYQSSSYYVSLLAEACGYKPLPKVGVIEDLQSRNLAHYLVRPADLPANSDPAAVYRARLAQPKKAGMGSRDMEEDEESGADASGQRGQPRNNYEDFAGGGKDKWKLDSRLMPPRSPYTIQTTLVIPAILITGINSTLPGKIVGQVSENVYDTTTGKHLLAPQGAKLEGKYSSDVGYGQATLLVAWPRLVFPDGKTMDIGAMPGSSGAGYAGFSDQVNNHYVRLFGAAIMMSAITAGVSLSQSRNQIAGTFGAPTTNSVLSAALGQQLGRVTSQMISRNLNISPTLEIRPGYRFNVTVTKDMVFSKPYQAFDY